MKIYQLLATTLLCATMTACSTSSANPSMEVAKTSAQPTPSNRNSSIVAAMDNYYEENTELTIDPCQDRFIQAMDALGYTLNPDVVRPEGRAQFNYWFAACLYRSNSMSVLVESATAPYMRKGQTLAPTNNSFGWAHMADIDGRQAIARPFADGDPSCMLSMETLFGSMTLTGGPRINTDPTDPCGKIEQLAREIEPWIDD